MSFRTYDGIVHEIGVLPSGEAGLLCPQSAPGPVHGYIEGYMSLEPVNCIHCLARPLQEKSERRH